MMVMEHVQDRNPKLYNKLKIVDLWVFLNLNFWLNVTYSLTTKHILYQSPQINHSFPKCKIVGPNINAH